MDRRDQKSLPPGLRNNNPGNIRLTNINWLGKVPNNQNTSGVHEQFINSGFGVRALMKQIQTTVSRTGGDPLAFVSDYAAGSSPLVLKNYADFIKANTGRNKITLDRDGLISAAKAITIFENGTPGRQFTDNEFNLGYSLLNQTSAPQTTPGAPDNKKSPLFLLFGGLLAAMYL